METDMIQVTFMLPKPVVECLKQEAFNRSTAFTLLRYTDLIREAVLRAYPASGNGKRTLIRGDKR